MNEELFDVLDEFHETLIEVEVLIDSAERDQQDQKRYSTYLKSALLLLSGKFENFVELAADTYVYLLNKNNIVASKIPERIRLKHTYVVLDNIQKKKNIPASERDIIRMLNEIGAIWIQADQPFSNLQLECKFSYGKHGSEELIKLFSVIGIENIFDQVDVMLPDATDPNILTKIDFKGTFNSITGMRNNILHQNASPNLTYVDVKNNLLIIKSFSTGLTNLLDSTINALVA